MVPELLEIHSLDFSESRAWSAPHEQIPSAVPFKSNQLLSAITN